MAAHIVIHSRVNQGLEVSQGHLTFVFFEFSLYFHNPLIVLDISVMYPFHENAGLFIVSKIIFGRSRLRYRLGTLTTYSDYYQVPPEVNFLINSSKQVISVILYFYNCVPK